MLSLRLKSIADFIKSTDLVADIGCDHALLGIYLVENKKLSEVIVGDILPSALNNARNNILKKHLEDKVVPKLGDGLEIIDGDTNTITISGMGTHTILNILNNKKINQINKMIICSNNDYYLLRKVVTKSGFYIVNEKLVFENNKYYITILFKRGYKKYTAKELRYGPILKNNKTSKKYYDYLIHDYSKLLEIIPRKNIINIIKIKYNLYLLNNIKKAL